MQTLSRPTMRGFTLTELLVVILLIGVFTGVMLAEMRGTYEDALLRKSARELMSGLSLASSRAVALNQTHVFEMDLTKHEFVVRSDAKPVPEEEAQRFPETRVMDDRVALEFRDPQEIAGEELEEEVEEIAPRDLIRFYPDGTADAREIVLRDRTNAELVLRINPITSRVRVIEEETTP